MSMHADIQSLSILVAVLSAPIAGGCGQPTPKRPLFAPAPDSPIAVGGGPGNVALGDLNGHGKPDLVAACGKAKTLTVLLGQGDGRFKAAAGGPVKLSDGPGEMVLGDLNGDGKPDLAVAYHDSYSVTLLLGDGKGGFAPAPNSPVAMKEGRHAHT